MKENQKSSFDNPAYPVEYLTRAVILLQSAKLFHGIHPQQWTQA